MIAKIRTGANASKPQKYFESKADEAKLVYGDLNQFTQELKENTYAKKYWHIALNFDEHLDDKKLEQVADDFFNEFYKGLPQDGLTRIRLIDNTGSRPHIHELVSTRMITDDGQVKHLDLFWKGTDTKYVEALKSVVEAKHDLKAATPLAIKTKSKIDHIQEKRAVEWRPPFEPKFDTKQARAESEKQFAEYAKELIASKWANNADELKEQIEQLGVKVIKTGYDIGKNEHWWTLENETGKLKIRGEILNPNANFKELQNDISNTATSQREPRRVISNDRQLQHATKELQRRRVDRLNRFEQKYSPSRKENDNKRAEYAQDTHTSRREADRHIATNREPIRQPKAVLQTSNSRRIDINRLDNRLANTTSKNTDDELSSLHAKPERGMDTAELLYSSPQQIETRNTIKENDYEQEYLRLSERISRNSGNSKQHNIEAEYNHILAERNDRSVGEKIGRVGEWIQERAREIVSAAQQKIEQAKRTIDDAVRELKLNYKGQGLER